MMPLWCLMICRKLYLIPPVVFSFICKIALICVFILCLRFIIWVCFFDPIS